MRSAPRIHWFWYWAGLTLAITAVGAVLGALVFPAWGLIFETGKSLGELCLIGVRTLAFYFLMWAPGSALVWTLKREYEARRESRSGTGTG